MHYIKLVDDEPLDYNIRQLKRDHPNVSFPAVISDEILAEYDTYPVTPVARPPSTNDTKSIQEGVPELISGSWNQVWVVTPKTPAEIQEEADRHPSTISKIQLVRYLDQRELWVGVRSALQSTGSAWEEFTIMPHLPFNDLVTDVIFNTLGYDDNQKKALFRTVPLDFESRNLEF